MTVRELIAALQQQRDLDAEAWFGWKRCEPVTIVEQALLSELAGDFSAEEAKNYQPDSERIVVLIR